MKLLTLNPKWVSHTSEELFIRGDGEPVTEREKVGFTFECPCGCDEPIYIPFANPMDGGPPAERGRPMWYRVGTTFDVLTITQLIARPDGCRWRGWIRDGHVETQP